MKIAINTREEWEAFSKGVGQRGIFPITIDYQFGTFRTVDQNSFQHFIYAKISFFLVSRNVRGWDEIETKKQMKNKFLGWHWVQSVNQDTGEIENKYELVSTSKLSIGAACDYITQLLDFACNIGCFIPIPADSDYMKNLKKQNGVDT